MRFKVANYSRLEIHLDTLHIYSDCAPAFELVRHRNYSERAIVKATVAIRIAWRLFLRHESP